MHDVDLHYKPRFALAFGRLMHRVSRVWFRYAFRGAANIPEGPVIFVGNHSGIGIADVLVLLGAWAQLFDGKRRGVGMMHKAFIEAPIVGHIARAFGAVPANADAAKAALARGHDVACFPGGDLDAARPFYDARKVYFGRRRGYLRLAFESGAPIVPIVTIGSHFTYTLLPGGSTIARVTRMKAWARCERFPLVLGTILAILFGVLAITGVLPWWAAPLSLVAALVPNPVRITTVALPAIDVVRATAHIEGEDARLEAAHELVHGTIARTLEHVGHDEETPTLRSLPA